MSKKKATPETPETPEPASDTELIETVVPVELAEMSEPTETAENETVEPELTPDAEEPADAVTETVISANNSIENFAVTENPNDSLNPLIVTGESVNASEPESHDYVFPNFPFATEHEQRLMGIDEVRAYAGKLLDLVQRGF